MCHEIEKGCVRFASLKPLNEGGRIVETTTLNRYSTHGPKMEWITQYFELGDEFDKRNTLGSKMLVYFKILTQDLGLRDKNTRQWTPLAHIIKKIGLDYDAMWAIMPVNLSYIRQINWYVDNIFMGEVTSRESAIKRLIDAGAKDTWAGDIWLAWGRFLSLSFSRVGLGCAVKVEGRFAAIDRKPWEKVDARVILYSLYKYSEGCGGYRHFRLGALCDRERESKGVSPAIIFGLDYESLKKVLIEAAFKFPKFITVSFTIGLDNIDLSDDESVISQEVLDALFN